MKKDTRRLAMHVCTQSHYGKNQTYGRVQLNS